MFTQITPCNLQDCVFDGNHPAEFPPNVKHIRYPLGCVMCSDLIDYTQSKNAIKKKILRAYQAYSVASAHITFRSFETVKELLKLEMEKSPDGSSEWNLSAYLAFFFEESPNFVMTKHLYLFVHFYNWLQTTLAYRLDRDEIALTAFEVIKRLPKKISLVGLQLLHNFVDAWNDMRKHFVEFNVCQQAREAQEAPIPEIKSEELRLIDLLSLDGETSGLIFRMLDGRLVHHQNKHFQQEHLKALLSPHENADFSLNRFEVLCDKLPEDFDLRFLSKYKSPLSTEVISLEGLDELSDYAAAHTKMRVEYDEASGSSFIHTDINQRAIARFVLKNYISGRHCFTIQKLLFPFPGRMEDQPLDINTSASSPIDNLSLQLDKQLSIAITDLYDYWKYIDNAFESSVLSRSDAMILETRLQRCAEEEAPNVVAVMLSAVRLIRSTVSTLLEMHDMLDQKLETVFKEVLSLSDVDFSIQNMFKSLGNLPISCLFSMSNRVCDWFYYQEFLFADLGQDFCYPLTEIVEIMVKDLKTLCIGESVEHACYSLKILQAAAEILLNDDIRHLLRNFDPLQNFASVARNKFDSLELTAGVEFFPHVAARQFREIIKSEDLKVRNYAYIMRFVRKLCGELAVYIATYKNIRKEDPMSRLYMEKVPEAYELLQEYLPGSEAVEDREFIEAADSPEEDFNYFAIYGEILRENSSIEESAFDSMAELEFSLPSDHVQDSKFHISPPPPPDSALLSGDITDMRPSPSIEFDNGAVVEGGLGSSFGKFSEISVGPPELSELTAILDGVKPAFSSKQVKKDKFCSLAGIDSDALEFLESEKIIVPHMLNGKHLRYREDDAQSFLSSLICLEDQHPEFDTDSKMEIAKSMGLRVVSQNTGPVMKNFITVAAWEKLFVKLKESQASIVLSPNDLKIKLALIEEDFQFLGTRLS